MRLLRTSSQCSFEVGTSAGALLKAAALLIVEIIIELAGIPNAREGKALDQPFVPHPLEVFVRGAAIAGNKADKQRARQKPVADKVLDDLKAASVTCRLAKRSGCRKYFWLRCCGINWLQKDYFLAVLRASAIESCTRSRSGVLGVLDRDFGLFLLL